MLADKMRHDDAYARAMGEALKFEPVSFGEEKFCYVDARP